MTSPVEQASSLYKEGRLAAAIDAATRAVKDSPSDLAARWLLAELLIVGGDLERADKQLDTLMSLDARAAVTVIPLRHLVRAETARREFFRSASLPDFLAEGPTKTMAAPPGVVCPTAGRRHRPCRRTRRSRGGRPSDAARNYRRPPVFRPP